MTEWTRVCALDDIPVLGARVIRGTEGDVCVFRTAQDEIFALRDQCPHRGGPLSQGIVHGTAVTCPLHNWVISLETGKALGADDGAVRTVPVRNDGGALFIALKSLLIAAE